MDIFNVNSSKNLNLDKTELKTFEKQDNKEEDISIFSEVLGKSDDKNLNIFEFEPNIPNINSNGISDEKIEEILKKYKAKNPEVDETNSINGKTRDRLKEDNDEARQTRINERKEKLSEAELAAYEKYEAYLEKNGLSQDDISTENIMNLDLGNHNISDFIDSLSDEELGNFLSAYDYVNDEEGGMEALVLELFDGNTNGNSAKNIRRIANLISDSDKMAILGMYADRLNERNLHRYDRYTLPNGIKQMIYIPKYPDYSKKLASLLGIDNSIYLNILKQNNSSNKHEL